MNYPFDKELLEKLCIYREGLLPYDKGYKLQQWGLVSLGSEIADLSGDETKIISFSKYQIGACSFAELMINIMNNLLHFGKN